MSINSRPEEISSIIKEQIKNYRTRLEMKETGTVILVGDGIARVYGLRECMASELLEFEDGSVGLAQNLEDETVSVALLSNENNIIKEYYDVKSECGYDYAYTFPGMNNVLQAAGRVIRREDDRGVIVLIDDRFDDPIYRDSLPKLWEGVEYLPDAKTLREVLDEFWNPEKT